MELNGCSKPKVPTKEQKVSFLSIPYADADKTDPLQFFKTVLTNETWLPQSRIDDLFLYGDTRKFHRKLMDIEEAVRTQ